MFALTWLVHRLGVLSAKGSPEVNIYTSIIKNKDDFECKADVFNACGVKDVAQQLSEYLRDNNVDVVYYGNYLVDNSIYTIQQTLVIERKSKDLKNAQFVANRLGVDKEYIIFQLSPERQVDVTVMIGKDYRILNPF